MFTISNILWPPLHRRPSTLAALIRQVFNRLAPDKPIESNHFSVSGGSDSGQEGVEESLCGVCNFQGMSYFSCPPLEFFFGFSESLQHQFPRTGQDGEAYGNAHKEGKVPCSPYYCLERLLEELGGPFLPSLEKERQMPSVFWSSLPVAAILWLKWMWSQEVIGSPSATFCIIFLGKSSNGAFICIAKALPKSAGPLNVEAP